MSVFIFRRDFRLYDNSALIECCKNNKTIFPIFIFTPEQIEKNKFKSSNAIQFMIDSLKDLFNETNTLNLLKGHYIEVIEDIIKNNNISSIFTNTDYTPYAQERDKNLLDLCTKHSIEFHIKHDICLLQPGIVLNNTNTHYQKFTPFYKKCITFTPTSPDKYKPKIQKFSKIKSKFLIDWKDTHKFYIHNNKLNIQGGRINALAILKSIKKQKFKSYEKNRNTLALKTTELSGYLKFGCISIREAYYTFLDLYGINTPVIRQLYWRDFYYQIGFNNPSVLGNALKPQYDKIKWVTNKKHLDAWKNAKTGFPIIDACMTQLNTTGYMHNRGRLIVSSFLIKNLQIDWREGELYFATQLLDYDPLVNNGNWQWMSGSGADSQQYIRIFNPWTQSSKFDSDASYIKQWLPIFKNIPAKDIHNWEIHHTKYNINYPSMIIDYKTSREKTMKMYKTALQY